MSRTEHVSTTNDRGVCIQDHGIPVALVFDVGVAAVGDVPVVVKIVPLAVVVLLYLVFF